MQRIALAALAAALLAPVGAMAQPADRSWTPTWKHVHALGDLIKDTGTTIAVLDNCPPNLEGQYRFQNGPSRASGPSVDVLELCSNNVDFNNPVAVWDVLAHEAVHVAQYCNGGHPLFTATERTRMVGLMASWKPERIAAATSKHYGDGDMDFELEAQILSALDFKTVLEVVYVKCKAYLPR